MPIYEFDCKACGHEFEKRMGFDDPRPRKCPKCGKLQVEKRVFPSVPAVLHMRYSPMHPRAMRGQRGPSTPRRKPAS
jgi:putative FmdB family regulatory protein